MLQTKLRKVMSFFVLVPASLVWMADLQLFGKAPMAAANGDAAQTQKERKGME